jgi:cold shock protein
MNGGVIRKYVDDRGFGFILRDDKGPDLFFHVSSVTGTIEPREGRRVTFAIGVGRNNSPAAIEVVVDG